LTGNHFPENDTYDDQGAARSFFYQKTDHEKRYEMRQRARQLDEMESRSSRPNSSSVLSSGPQRDFRLSGSEKS